LETKLKERRISELMRELNILNADIYSTQIALIYGVPGYNFDSQNELSEIIQNLKARRDEIDEEIIIISDPNYKLSDRSYATYKYIENLVKDWYGPSEFGGRKSKRKRSKRKSSKRRKNAKRKTSKKTRK
jgi:hypothetical protein